MSMCKCSMCIGNDVSYYLKRIDKSILGRIEGNVGKVLGSGADGEVFEYGRKRVIKFGNYWKFHHVRPILEKLSGRRLNGIVRVYEYGRMKGGMYYVIMERLSPLTSRERSAISRLVSERLENWDQGRGKMGERMERLRKNLVKYKSELKLNHGDLHCGNVMKSGDVLKLVDVEGFKY